MRHLSLKRLILVACWAFLGLSSEVTFAQEEAECVNGIIETSNPELFQLDESGDVLHLPTGLVFMRCALGQTWDSTGCSGDADAMTWQEALQASVGYDFNNSQNWRLPNVKELTAITERACTNPSINVGVFPQTQVGDYWTSTPSAIDGERAWVVGFFNGTSSLKAKDRSIFVRLVRTKLPNE